jgi:hypothetical protein
VAHGMRWVGLDAARVRALVEVHEGDPLDRVPGIRDAIRETSAPVGSGCVR